MKLNRTSAVGEYRLVSRFGELRSQLLEETFSARRKKPLAFWALPDDRRLPLAFMGHTIEQLLATPFDELLATPGVGQKKMCSLVGLLERVVVEDPDQEPALQATEPVPASGNAAETGFDAARVSESQWSQWRASVERHQLGDETLGRFAPSLERLPRVLWNTTLDTYTHLTLAQIRQLKTHGEKRVAAVLEVFSELHAVLAHLGTPGNLAVRIVPKFAGQLEHWTLAASERAMLPSAEELEQHLVRPLLDQVYIDAGEPIAQLSATRLGLQGTTSSVRQSARDLGLTRARIYQLLADVGAMMKVRWPEGQFLVHQLVERIQTEVPATNRPQYDRFMTAVDLFFPGRRGHAELTASEEAAAESDEADAATQRRAG